MVHAGFAFPPADVVWFDRDFNFFGVKCPYCVEVHRCIYGDQRDWPCRYGSPSVLNERFIIEPVDLGDVRFEFVAAMDLFMTVESAQRFKINGPSIESSSDTTRRGASNQKATTDLDDLLPGMGKLGISSSNKDASETPSQIATCLESTQAPVLWFSPKEDEIRSNFLAPLSKPYYYQRSEEGEVVLLAPIAQYRMKEDDKGFALLLQPRTGNITVTQSGWLHKDQPHASIAAEGPPCRLLGGTFWTARVRDLCAAIDHTLNSHAFDQGSPGRYYACHAEKQLIAFAIDSYISRDFKIDPDEESAKKLRNLPEIELEILLNKLPCSDCDRLINSACKIFGFKVKLCIDEQCDGTDVERDVFIKGNREAVCYPSAAEPIPARSWVSTV
jgi:hypothetical protein